MRVRDTLRENEKHIPGENLTMRVRDLSHKNLAFKLQTATLALAHASQGWK